MFYAYALDVLCAQLTRDLFAIAKFLFVIYRDGKVLKIYGSFWSDFFNNSVLFRFCSGSV